MTLKTVNRPSVDQKTLNKLVEDAWLGLKIPLDEDQLYNPIQRIPDEFQDNPQFYLTWIMSKPEYLSMFCKEILNVQLLPMQALVLEQMWSHRFPMMICSRGFSKSYLLAVYALLRAIFMPGRKIVICGSAFRQSKIIFEYMENIYRNAPIFKDMLTFGGALRDDNIISHGSALWEFKIGQSCIMAIPLGSGDTVRGLRANDILSDEQSSINRHIFENVIAGFGVVAANPIEAVKKQAEQEYLASMGIEAVEEEASLVAPNQIVLSGTAYYRFNHFFESYTKYKNIITSRGDKGILRGVVGDEVDNPAFNWKDYCIIRMPYTLIPRGFHDAAQISRSKVSITDANFLCEYGACFPSDSNGFFKRSLIEQCVPSDNNVITIGGHRVDFTPRLKGSPNSKYVIAVDPASESDNFAICVVELKESHRRIVYCWTTNKKAHIKQRHENRTTEDNYWAFCVRKIRKLMQTYNCVGLAIDSGGGGNSIKEAFKDKDKLEPNEEQIWPAINPDKPAYTDVMEGPHLIHMMEFANAKWLGDAYFSTKKDFEDKHLVFPSFDGATLGLAECVSSDYTKGGLEDTMENIIEEIEELKNELTAILHSKTPSGRDTFDVPDFKTVEGKKAKVKKDRATALIMANSLARDIMRNGLAEAYESNGGISGENSNISGNMYQNNPWYSKAANDAYSMY